MDHALDKLFIVINNNYPWKGGRIVFNKNSFLLLFNNYKFFSSICLNIHFFISYNTVLFVDRSYSFHEELIYAVHYREMKCSNRILKRKY